MGATNTLDGCPIGWTTWGPNPENCINSPGGNGNVVRMKSSIKAIYNDPSLPSEEILAKAAQTVVAQAAASVDAGSPSGPIPFEPQQDNPFLTSPAPQDLPAAQSLPPVMESAGMPTMTIDPSYSFWGDVGRWAVGAGEDLLCQKFGICVGNSSPTGPGGPGGATVGGGGNSIPDVGQAGGFTNTADQCPQGYYRVGNQCVSPGDAWPGGNPVITPVTNGSAPSGGGQYYQTGLGFAVAPATMTTTRLRCPGGMVLGRDNLCYEKLSNQYRKWPHHKPYITRADYKAISRADRARKKLVRLTKRSGAYAAMRKPSTGRGGSRGVITKSEAARALRR